MRIFYKTILEDMTLERFFQQFGEAHMPDEFKEYSTMMQALFNYLETHVEGPDTAISTALHNVYLSSLETSEGVSAIIYTWKGLYCVEYKWFQDNPPWADAKVIGSTSSVSEAADMILDVLRVDLQDKASPFMTGRIDLHATRSSGISSKEQTKPGKFRRISAQQPETLEAYYTRLCRELSCSPEELQQMINFLHYLEKRKIGTDYWVYTSFTHLIVTNSDCTNDGVKILLLPVWEVSYPASPPEVLWENAWVKGFSQDKDQEEMAEMVRVALARTFE
jgi:hypothetical protein